MKIFIPVLMALSSARRYSFGSILIPNASKISFRSGSSTSINQYRSLGNWPIFNLFTLFKLIYDGKKTNAEKRAAAEQYEKDHPVDESVMIAIASTSNIDLDLYKKGDVTVCRLFDELEKQGEMKKARETARDMYADGMSIEKIVKYVKYPVEVIEKWLGLVKA